MPGRFVTAAALAIAAGNVFGGLIWQEGPQHRSAALSVTLTQGVGFTRLSASQTKLLFTNVVAQERHLTNQILLNGSGVAAGDFDNDGRCDLYFCAIDGENKLYRNLGNCEFEDVTRAAGVACAGVDATGAAFLDVDGDEHLDLIVNSIGQGTRVFINSGRGSFKESLLLNPNRAGMSLAVGDIDGDGDLDLYIANYRTVTIRDQPNTRFTLATADGQPMVRAVNSRPLTDPDLTNRFVFRVQMAEGRASLSYDENGEPDALYRNDGGGRFAQLPDADTFLDVNGARLGEPQFGWGLSAMFRDMNGDGAPDLYVCNDFKSPDRIWINDGSGRFRAMDTRSVRQTSLSSMGVDFADINRDGHHDLFVLDMLSRHHHRRFVQRTDIQPELSRLGDAQKRVQTPRNTLFINRGDGTYAEIAQLAGLDATEWSWTPIFLDVDLDGYEDLLVSSGFERDGMNVDVLRRIELQKKQGNLSALDQLRLRKQFPRLETGTMAFRNSGNLTFQETDWGLRHAAVSQGMALADLDNDGDLDVAVNNMNGPAVLFRNDCAAPRLAVVLKGKTPNRRGIGARIEVSGGPVAQSQEMICGGRYLSSDQPMRTFATGSSTNLAIRVRWRSGRTSIVNGAIPNRVYEIDESAAAVREDRSQEVVHESPMFQDVSEWISHTHHEEEFDDFARQPLLPNRLSQLGPGVSWFDLDDDGWEELLVPSGKGGAPAVFRNERGKLRGWSNSPWTDKVAHDQTTILGVAGGVEPRLVAGSACYEAGRPLECAYEYIGKNPPKPLPLHSSSSGPLALGDFDGDGYLDLCVGGRVVPSAYPAPASSLLLRGGAQGFLLDEQSSKSLAEVGMITGAVFSDLDGDGAPELVLACEWGPIRVFRSNKLGLREVTAELGLEQYKGWWTGVTTGDFDGDGRMDIAAANRGRNSKYERFRQQPLRLFYGDLNGDGALEVIESCFDSQSKRWVPFQPYQVVTAALPPLQERFQMAEAYAKSGFEQVYQPVLDRLTRLEANWLESTVFLNRGGTFQARVLPTEAQFAPAFGICAADLDNDGREDVFLSQNFFATSAETSRYDAGRGLWLRGNGDGSFTPLLGQDSGVLAYGDGRGAAVCDFDHDGRVDLAVGQNAGTTKLFRNVHAPAGLRVRLRGPPGNPSAIGAVIRAVTGADAMGPARELHAGSGYWSQDSATQVLPSGAQRIQIRWPGGRVTTSEIPPGSKEIIVSPDGRLEVSPQG